MTSRELILLVQKVFYLVLPHSTYFTYLFRLKHLLARKLILAEEMRVRNEGARRQLMNINYQHMQRHHHTRELGL